jgi:hypothetical protein
MTLEILGTFGQNVDTVCTLTFQYQRSYLPFSHGLEYELTHKVQR